MPTLILGWSPTTPALVKTLWGLGTLGDIGFDVYDWIFSTVRMLRGESPFQWWVVICCLHHPMALGFILPMNTSQYVSSPWYHAIAVSLLLAAGICFSTGQYKFSLDVSTAAGLRKFKAIVVIQFITIWITRVFVWYPCGVQPFVTV